MNKRPQIYYQLFFDLRKKRFQSFLFAFSHFLFLEDIFAIAELDKMTTPDGKYILVLLSIVLLMMVIFCIAIFFILKQRVSIRTVISNNQLLNKNQMELQKSNNELQVLLSQREEYIKKLQDFNSIISHDIKEQVNMIGAFVSQLKKHSSLNTSHKSLQILNTIEDSTWRLNNFVKSLYNRSDEWLNQFVEKPKDNVVIMDSLVREVLTDMQLAINKSGAVIDILDLPHLKVDETQFYQIYLNLISNAIKYRDPHRKLVISMGWYLEDHQIVLYVRDNGTGVYEEELVNIFDQKVRANGTDYIEGKGLGLSICQDIVTNHEGQIYYSANQDFGTTFYIQLPTKFLHHSF